MKRLDSTQFEYLQPVTWADVWKTWRQGEANNSAWVAHYQQKGFDSWEDWRQATHGALHGSEHDWHLYNVKNPLVSVPSFRGGPFKNWQRLYYQGQPSPQFSELMQNVDLQTDQTVQDFLAHFPTETTISGMVIGADIYIIEGMHRCCALALAAQRQLTVPTTLHLLVANYRGATLPELGTDIKV